MQSCCGNAVEECFCGNNSFVRSEEVCGILEPKLQEIKDEQAAFFDEIRSEIINQACLQDNCGVQKDITGSNLIQIDDENIKAGKKLIMPCNPVTRNGQDATTPSENTFDQDVSANTANPDGGVFNDTWYVGADHSVDIVNDTCCTMCGFLHIDVPYEYTISAGTFVRRNIQINIDGAGWEDFKRRGERVDADRFISEDMDKDVPICIPAETTRNYAFRMVISIEDSGGNNIWHKNGIGLNYHMTSKCEC